MDTIKYQYGINFIYIPKEIEHLIGKVIFRPNGAYIEDKQGRPLAELANGKWKVKYNGRFKAWPWTFS